MLVLRPVGRGNWATLLLQVSGRRAPLPLEVHVGQRMHFAGKDWRVVEVRL